MTHDWKVVKAAFMTGEHLTLEATAKAFGIRPGYLRQRAATEGWSESRAKLEQKAEARAEEVLIETQAQRIAQAKERHLKLASMLQGKAIQRLQRLNPETGKDEHRFGKDETALQALSLGVKLERDTLGISKDEEHGPQAPHLQVNLNVQQAALVLDSAGDGLRRALLVGLEQALQAGAEAVPRKRALS